MASPFRLVEHRGITRRGPYPSAVLRRPAQAAWTRLCSNVHRTFSRRSGPFGFDPPMYVSVRRKTTGVTRRFRLGGA